MKTSRKILRRALALIICLAIILPATVLNDGKGGTAQALTSLPYIEELKGVTSTFGILEVIPAAGEGSIGYYIDGQEPSANWANEAGTTAVAADKAARKAYADNLFSKLSSAGLLGSGDTTPLEFISDYTETYPWMPHDGYTKLTLDHVENTNATGYFNPASNGAYTQSKDFSYVSDGTGEYVQIIAYFSKNYVDQNISNGRYYYTPVFTQIAANGLVDDGTAIYSQSGEGYEYFGTVGAEDYAGMEIGQVYYYVSSYSAPSDTAYEGSYVAVSEAYRTIRTGETGYFGTANLKYTYVGSGGTYDFTYDAAGPSFSLDYNTVYYTGGYKNNNWFLRYVFDWTPSTDSKPTVKIKVTSVVGSNVTASLVNQADMVVLANGFAPGEAATAYYSANDITVAAADAILAAVEKTDDSDLVYNMPIIIDNRITGCGGANIRSLATTLKNGSALNTFVNASIFFFAPDTTRSALATNNFTTMYNSSDYAISGSAFYPAYDVIAYENFIRQQEDPAATLLEQKINLARAIRYVINYAKQRVKGQKSSIEVLEIEASHTQLLTKAEVASWTGFDEADITISAMSTLEFIGKNDDLIENYDIIYIGDNNGTTPSHIDAGYIYENVGSEVTLRNDVVGLTDSEYTNTVFATSGGKSYYSLKSAQTTRYSGNDLSTKKLNDLNAFALAGHPVIYDSGLTSGSVSQGSDEVSFSVTITGEQSGNYAVLTSSIAASVGELPIAAPTYQWYRNGTAISGAAASTYTTASAGNYYCTATYTIGGSAYTATSNTINCQITSAATQITNSDLTKTEGSFTENVTTSFTASIAFSNYAGNSGNNKMNNLTAGSYTFVTTRSPSTSLPSGTTMRYQWYRDSYRYGIFSGTSRTASTVVSTDYSTEASSSRNIQLVVPEEGFGGFIYYYDIYYCVATLVNSTTHVVISSAVSSESNSYRVDRTTSGRLNISEEGDSPSTGRYVLPTTQTFTPTVSPSSGTASNTQTLTASSSLSGYNPSYQWYRDGVLLSGQTNQTLSVANSTWASNESHSYYCRVTQSSATSAAATTNTVTLTRRAFTITVTNNGGGTSQTIPAQTEQKFSISSAKVDNCSNMYTFLNGNKNLENVMRSTDVTSDALLRYLNLSKPQIDLISYPAVFSRNDSGVITGKLEPDAAGDYTLTFDFVIKNETDTTPLSTSYYCNLYIDSDSDGRYITQERVGSISIREAPQAGETEGRLVQSGELKAGQEYIVTRLMPVDMAGFIPWKLEIIKVNDESVHTSESNYTFIQPVNPEVINILQINSGRTAYNATTQPYGYGDGGPYGGLPLDLTVAISDAGISASRAQITALLAEISDEYTINIQTITTREANSIASTPITNRFDGTEYSNITELLHSYDMLIAGFDDAYNELSKETADAVVGYLEDNYPILYTHDTTSMPNVPKIYMDRKSSGSGCQIDNSYYFGYYFNSELRDPLGLDRFGVSDATYGLTSKSNEDVSQSGIVAAGYSGLNDTIKQELISNGYSIAYVPGSNTAGTGGTPLGMTQGLTNYTYNGNQVSTAVTQINKGMITTYPFDVNTSTFGGSLGSTMPILSTHQQYYQANMNPDDVMVWYCLSGSGYEYNDASSAYYIFSNGNATYSGLGHSLRNIGLPEAKLFVNSLIAAYRVTNFLPEIKFTDDTGENKIDTFLIPADHDGLLTPDLDNITDTSRFIYFTVNDSNVGRDKTVTAVVSYGETSATIINVPLYDSQTDKAVGSGDTLVSGLAYYVKVDDIIKIYNEKGIAISENGTKVYITVTTSTANTRAHGVSLSKTESITLRQLKLFELS